MRLTESCSASVTIVEILWNKNTKNRNILWKGTDLLTNQFLFYTICNLCSNLCSYILINQLEARRGGQGSYLLAKSVQILGDIFLGELIVTRNTLENVSKDAVGGLLGDVGVDLCVLFLVNFRFVLKWTMEREKYEILNHFNILFFFLLVSWSFGTIQFINVDLVILRNAELCGLLYANHELVNECILVCFLAFTFSFFVSSMDFLWTDLPMRRELKSSSFWKASESSGLESDWLYNQKWEENGNEGYVALERGRESGLDRNQLLMMSKRDKRRKYRFLVLLGSWLNFIQNVHEGLFKVKGLAMMGWIKYKR